MSISKIAFTINGELYQVGCDDFPVDTTLNSFIRNNAQLSGTKCMCFEGGCGCCVVTLKGVHPVSGNETTWAVNSCLWFLYSCDGFDIITIEGIGNQKINFHPLQKRLNELNGSQCGYCSPGMVMNMFSLIEANNGQVSAELIENSFSGNLCRCTGYRPILDAFKSFANDKDNSLADGFQDIEDLSAYCMKTGVTCGQAISKGLCSKSCKVPSIIIDKFDTLKFNDERQWYKVNSLKSLLELLNSIGDSPYMLVAGNTAHGVYRRKQNIKIFINIFSVTELRSYSIGSSEILLGANCTLAETINILNNASKSSGFEYCQLVANHILLIANTPVRNVATIAGNLSIKHDHNEFPSDMFLLLETIGAIMTITDGVTQQEMVAASGVLSYLKLKMGGKVLVNIKLPKLDPNMYVFRSYKIMQRHQNSHAYVNAGFLIQFKNNNINSARICFGGINPNFVHATATEKLLINKNPYDSAVLHAAIQSLNNEVKPDWVLPDASPKYRKNLAISLFYKFILNTCPEDKLSSINRSGGQKLYRPLSSGIQKFTTNKKEWPINEPVNKLEGLAQTSGEAKYINDMPPMRNQLWAAFVSATKIGSKIAKIDESEALKIPGVRYFFSAKDIPGKNDFAPKSYFTIEPEEIFLSDGPVLYYDQPIGIIVADRMELAILAVSKVKVMYENPVNSMYAVAKSLLGSIISSGMNNNNDKVIYPTLKDAIELGASDRLNGLNLTTNMDLSKDATTTDSVTGNKTIKGIFEVGGQYHFTMETQTTVCIPGENHSLDLHCSTNWLDLIQIAVAECLEIPENKINMHLRHTGGSFGSKISRAGIVACACALACYLTKFPIRFVMTIQSNMNVIGKRFATHSEYTVTVNEQGKILNYSNLVAQDYGCSLNDSVQSFVNDALPNCYMSDGWAYKIQAVKTDAPSQTWCRAPGTLEAIAITENIMEHIAWTLNLNPMNVRLANIPADSIIRQMLPEFIKESEFEERQKKVLEFNSKNRWHKRGISLTPMRWPLKSVGGIPVFVAIYHRDGTVVISHGGIECGQGINTKAAQVAAYSFGISMDMVDVKPTNNVIAANAITTGGSVTSDLVCLGVKSACEELLKRMKPVRDQMPNAKWPEVTEACYQRLIDLTAQSLSTSKHITHYGIYGMSCSEVEIDILTGEIQLTRVDLLEDTGQSISPIIDIGQVEGAFIMGVGYWLTEQLIYDRNYGKLLTDRTWNYKIPGAKDIPIDFRTTLWQKTGNASGVLRSKGTGEPAVSMAVSIVFAIRNALYSARKDAKLPNVWLPLGSAITPEKIFLNAGNNIVDFIL